MTKKEAVAIFKAAFAASVWGASFIATKVALQDLSPYSLIWARFAIGIPVLGGALFFRKQKMSLPAGILPSLALLGFLGVALHQWLQSVGLLTAQASTSAWIITTTPVFIALLGYLVLKERLGGAKVAGIAVAALGVVVVVSKGDLSSLISGRFGTVGDFLMMISAVNWAVFSVLSRAVLRRCPAALMMFYVMSIGWLFLNVPFFLLGPGFVDFIDLRLSGWAGLFFLGIFCSGLAYIFWYDALEAMEVSRVGAFMYLEPLVALVVAALVLGEPVTFVVLTGGAMILLGVWLVNRSSGK